MISLTKEQFLIEHNKLSPLHLQATLALLNRFKEEKRPLLTEKGWVIDKLRIPLISWMLSLPQEKETKNKGRKMKAVFRNYPDTKIHEA